MSAALAYIDDWTPEPNPELRRPRLYLASSRCDDGSIVTYDPLKQIVEVSDAKGNLTHPEYDNLGRRTSLDNPDTGKTVTVYDPASNVISKITANLAAEGKSINYTYDYNRLTGIHYPDNTGNDVAYTYGDNTAQYRLKNQIGRIVKVADASGSEEREYGKLGETVKQTRTIASHTQGKSNNRNNRNNRGQTTVSC